jgi:putative tricarboxylic transport membrane protein
MANNAKIGNDTPEASEATKPSKIAEFAELIVAAVVVILGIVILIETQDIRVPRAYTKVGPRVIPEIIGWALIIVGAWYVIDILRTGGAAPSAESEDVDVTLPTDWWTVGILALALIIFVLLIERAGFVVASAVMFEVAAYAMGSRRYLRDIPIAIVLSLAVYLVFTRGLEVRLPAGWLAGVL